VDCESAHQAGRHEVDQLEERWKTLESDEE
jgi:hypothetical protein